MNKTVRFYSWVAKLWNKISCGWYSVVQYVVLKVCIDVREPSVCVWWFPFLSLSIPSISDHAPVYWKCCPLLSRREGVFQREKYLMYILLCQVRLEEKMEKIRRYWNTPSRSAYVFIAPSVILLLLFNVIPLVMAFGLSFFDVPITLNTASFIGFDNFIEAFHDARFLNSLKIRNPLFMIY